MTILCATGCAGLQDTQYSTVNRMRAHAAYYGSYSAAERRKCGSDYGAGFRAGYFDASTGQACGTPAVPPPCYWSTKYQSCEGQEAIQSWYRGYQCGVACAEGAGYPAFHDIPTGPEAPHINQTGCGACYAADGCSCNGIGDVEQGLPAHEPILNFEPLDSVGLIGPTDFEHNHSSLSTQITTASAVRVAQ